MKKAIIFILIVTLILIAVPSVMFAAKPDGAGAQKVEWNLSAAVMPVPPYGSRDIIGSDTASKLIVNQPNGNTVVTITGVMNGLNPNTTYTVFLSNGYEPYVDTGWNVENSYILRLVTGSYYNHDVVIVLQTDGTFTGHGGYPAGGSSYSFPYNETIDGIINVSTGDITINSVYENGYWYKAVGTIAPDGTMSGTWTAPNVSLGSWSSISGNATKTHTGDTGWPGLFNSSTVPKFTFTTDETGSGSWHINLKDADFSGTGSFDLSVWINVGGTILISDVFTVVVE